MQAATNTAITQINTTSKVIIPTIKSESSKLYIEAKAATTSTLSGALGAIDKIPVAGQREQKINHGVPGEEQENNYGILMIAAAAPAALAGLVYYSQQ